MNSAPSTQHSALPARHSALPARHSSLLRRLGSLSAWLVWILLITFPLAWIAFDGKTATWNRERLKWLAALPGTLAGRPGLLAALAGAIAAAAGVAIWRRRGIRLPHLTLAEPLRRAAPVAGWIALPLLLALPLVASPMQMDNYLVRTAFYILLAQGLNLVVGMAGLLVLGYAAFAAIGGYTFAILAHFLQIPFWAALPVGTALAAAAGFLVGLPSLRLRSDYLAIVTLGFGETVRYLCKNLPALTLGEQGIVVPEYLRLHAFTVFDHTIPEVAVAWGMILPLAALTMFLAGRLQRSRTGRGLLAMREDELAAGATGINTVGLKLFAFTLSAGVAGLAGVFYVAHDGFISPDTFNFEESILILAMVVLGGMGRPLGVALGAAILHVVPTLLRDQFPDLQDYRKLLLGAVMVLLMMFRPRGLLGRTLERSDGEH
ncbi:MAG: branched-chain amino acid ABC transporter permease [Planctomycetota bacterium]